MDPNEALKKLRAWAAAPASTDMNDAIDAAIVFDGLDEWLSHDGFLPDDWQSDDEKAARRG